MQSAANSTSESLTPNTFTIFRFEINGAKRYHNPWMLCSAYDTRVSQPIYALSITFYTVGIPIMYVSTPTFPTLFWFQLNGAKRYAAVALKYRQLKAAKDEAACTHIRSLFGAIMQSYREEYFWWEVVAISRRFLICACASLLSPRVDALTLSIFVILTLSLVAHVRSPPPTGYLCNTSTYSRISLHLSPQQLP